MTITDSGNRVNLGSPRLSAEKGDGPAGRIALFLRADLDAEIVRQALTDPDRYVPEPAKESQLRKARSRRAVHSFHHQLGDRRERLYLKLYRVRGMKDLLEEALFGKRAVRAFHTGLEAERRGIDVSLHLGASHRDVGARRPARSVLLTLGLPHGQDVRTVLKHQLGTADAAADRRAFLTELGRFLGAAHRSGLIHGDLKIRNVFVRQLTPPRLALIDLDRSRFVTAESERGLIRQAIDLRTLSASLRGRIETGELRRVLAAYVRARGVSRKGRRRLLRAWALLGGRL